MWPQLGMCGSVRMSMAVSMSMNQSSSFEESSLSNVGISCSMVVVRFDSLWVACKVSVGVCVPLYSFVHLFITRLGAECGWSIIVRCCSLSVSCISSAIGVYQGVVDFKLVNWSLSCQNCSNKSAKGQQVSVSSWYLSDDSLSPLSIVCSGGARSKGWVFGGKECPPCHDFHILLSWCVFCVMFQRCLAEPSGVICLWCQDMCMLQWWCMLQEAKVTYQVMVVMSMLDWSSSVQVRGFAKWYKQWSNWLTGEHMSCLLASIFDCSTVRSLIMAPVLRCRIAFCFCLTQVLSLVVEQW